MGLLLLKFYFSWIKNAINILKREKLYG